MRGSGAAWGLWGALLGGAAGCRGPLPPPALHEAVTAWFADQGIAVADVRCPQALPRERGHTVTCEATAGPGSAAVTVEVTVEVTDDDGALVVRPRHPTVVAARAELEIAQTLRDQGYAVTRVRCEGPLWVARAGAEHRCEVTDEHGRRYAWHGVWSGEGTRQRTTVTPLPAVEGGAS